ncbi:MAG: Ger(x)C family spore germination protein [Clostridia bacterium]|nr:Ger(x)C family spore germination protein [Clostridia bacterium]
MKKYLKNIFIFIVIIVFILAFSHSYSSLNIDNLAYVVALGIDSTDDNNLQVTFQFSTPVSIESGEKPNPINNTIISPSISNAINIMNSYLGTPISFSHCKVIIFSEQLAKQGISDEIYTLINDTQVTPSSNIVISKCDAKNYIEQTTPELENLVSKYYESFENSSKNTGYIPDATIGDFFNDLTSRTREPYAILGGLNAESRNEENSTTTSQNSLKANTTSISGKNGSENFGVAVFREDTLVGELNAFESVAFLNIRNNIDRFLISIQDPENENNLLDIYMTPSNNATIKVNTSNQTPYIKINCKYTGRIYSMTQNSKYLSPEVLDSISKSCDSYLESLFTNYLYKTSKEFNSDINSVGDYALKNFFTTKEFEDYSWLENYKNAFFKVNVDSSVKSGMLITET